MDVFKTIQDWWFLLTTIVGGIFTAILQWRKSRRTSRVQLKKTLEDLSLKLVGKVEMEYKQKVKIAQLNYLLELIKQRYPNQYEECKKIIENDQVGS